MTVVVCLASHLDTIAHLTVLAWASDDGSHECASLCGGWALLGEQKVHQNCAMHVLEKAARKKVGGLESP